MANFQPSPELRAPPFEQLPKGISLGAKPAEKVPPSGPLHDAVLSYQKNPTPQTADAYLEAAGPLLSRAVRVYGGAATPSVTAKAKQIALDVGQKYDPKHGVKPETFLLTHLQSLRRFGSGLASPVRVPDQYRTDAPKIDQYVDDLRHNLGREPSDAEVADATGLPVKRVSTVRGGRAAFTSSAAPTGATYVIPQKSQDARNSWLRFVYEDLDPASQVVLEHTVGWKPHKTTQELAKMLGVTSGAISQRKGRIENALAEYERFASGGR